MLMLCCILYPEWQMTLFVYILMEENWNMDILVTCMAHIKDLQRINTLYTNTAYKCTIKHKIER